VDQGDLAGDAGAVAPSSVPPRTRLTSSRALLLTLGAVLGGVALSLLMSSSPAHAAEGGDAGPGGLGGPLAAATSSASSATGAVEHSVVGAVSAVSSTLDTGIPLIQHSVDAAGGSIATQAPVTAPVVAPVVASVDVTLTALRHVVAPTVQGLPGVGPLSDRLPVTQGVTPAHHWTPPAGSGQMASESPAPSALGGIPAAQSGEDPAG